MRGAPMLMMVKKMAWIEEDTGTSETIGGFPLVKGHVSLSKKQGVR
jgi:hypothetical protein